MEEEAPFSASQSPILRTADDVTDNDSLAADFNSFGVASGGSDGAVSGAAEWLWNPKRLLIALAASDMNGISVKLLSRGFAGKESERK